MATTQVNKRTEYGLGTADHNALVQQFATALQDYTPEVARQLQQSVRDDLNTGNPDVPAFDPNFSNAPTVEKFWPDRGWPAGGTTNAADISEGPPAKSSGAGSTTQPSDSASSISRQTIGELIFGTSQPG